MPCENKCRAMSAARCPQIKHFLGRQRLTVKSEFFKPFSHQRLTAIILGGDRLSLNELFRQRDGRVFGISC